MGTLSEALIIQKPAMMHEIHTQDEKHINAEEETTPKGKGQHGRSRTRTKGRQGDQKPSKQPGGRGAPGRYLTHPTQRFTPLNAHPLQIYNEVKGMT